ncbi:Cyclin [Fragilaria crotonensis]|nr:Cyclin [Fragilaria crotonensis]
MTSLYLAVKLHESGEKLSFAALIDMSRGYFAMEDFEDAELDILEALEWRLSPPTANCFMMEFQKLYPVEMSNEWILSCEELLELSVADAYFVPRKDSQLALAAILVTAEKFNVSQEELDVFCGAIQNVVDVKDADFIGVYDYLQDIVS